MGKKQETLQFKGLENQRVVGIFSHHGQFYTPDPTSQLSSQITGLGAREHGWRGEGGGRARQRFWRLPWPPGDSSIQPGLSYLTEMEPQSGSCSPF